MTKNGMCACVRAPSRARTRMCVSGNPLLKVKERNESTFIGTVQKKKKVSVRRHWGTEWLAALTGGEMLYFVV